MGVRFLTFTSMMHDNLMPWLEENQDVEKFRLILRKVALLQAGGTSPFIFVLPAALRELGIYSWQNLADEWELFSKIPMHPDTAGTVSPFRQLAGDNPKIVFYTLLIAHCLEALFSGIILNISESRSENVRMHRVINTMKALSEMIITARILMPSEESDRVIINRLLAGLIVLFTETGHRFPGSVEPSLLRVNKTDTQKLLLETINNDENTRNLFSILAQRYFPVTAVPDTLPASLSSPELQNRKPVPKSDLTVDQIDNKTIIEEVENTRAEIAMLKKAITGATTKNMEPQPETGDRRIGSAEVCTMLNISKSTLKAQRDRGHYSFTKIGSRYYYSLQEISQALKLKKQKR